MSSKKGWECNFNCGTYRDPGNFADLTLCSRYATRTNYVCCICRLGAGWTDFKENACSGCKSRKGGACKPETRLSETDIGFRTISAQQSSTAQSHVSPEQFLAQNIQLPSTAASTSASKANIHAAAENKINLQTLRDMGFRDEPRIIELIQLHRNNLELVVESLTADARKDCSISSSKAAAASPEPEFDECTVCLAAPRSVRLRPCCHAVLCAACAAALMRRGGARCPVCRAGVEGCEKGRFAAAYAPAARPAVPAA